jgi:hypothetical protein
MSIPVTLPAMSGQHEVGSPVDLDSARGAIRLRARPPSA